MADSISLVFCTCPNLQVAESLAEQLVESRFAACVSILGPVRSIYRWQGKTERTDDQQLLIKTGSGQVDALVEEVRRLHPYELPEIIAVPSTGGLPEYLEWVSQCTKN